MIKTLVIFLTLLFAHPSWCAETRPMDEVLVRNNARKHLYPGGIDEEPLKVQASLPILKIKSAVEEEEPPMPDETTD